MKRDTDKLKRDLMFVRQAATHSTIPVLILEYFPEDNGVWLALATDESRSPIKKPGTSTNQIFKLKYPPEVSTTLGIVGGKTLGTLHTKNDHIISGSVEIGYRKGPETTMQYQPIRAQWAI